MRHNNFANVKGKRSEDKQKETQYFKKLGLCQHTTF